MERSNAHPAESRHRCEYGKALSSEGECQKAGEVLQPDGSLLCVDHAKLTSLETREGALLGTVFEMDKWLDDPNNRVDDLHWRRSLRRRDETVEQLRFNRTLIETRKGTNRRR